MFEKSSLAHLLTTRRHHKLLTNLKGCERHSQQCCFGGQHPVMILMFKTSTRAKSENGDQSSHLLSSS
jgi:hypothetical protein|tara:strand:+ start:1213 stop:1416 length:204 start_codon:yes stop_codon:yes gene_type:complete